MLINGNIALPGVALRRGGLGSKPVRAVKWRRYGLWGTAIGQVYRTERAPV